MLGGGCTYVSFVGLTATLYAGELSPMNECCVIVLEDCFMAKMGGIVDIRNAV